MMLLLLLVCFCFNWYCFKYYWCRVVYSLIIVVIINCFRIVFCKIVVGVFMLIFVVINNKIGVYFSGMLFNV